MRIDLATKSLDSVASLVIGNINLNQSRLIRQITKNITVIKTNLTIQLITKFESQNLKIDHSFDTVSVFYYDIACPLQMFYLSLCIGLELTVFIW
jgi:hypothetical protein